MAAQRPTRSQARLFAQLVAEFEPQVRRAFMASVTDLQAGVNWTALLSALTAGNVEGAIAALNIDAAAWAEYSAVVTEAYAKAGASTAAQIRSQGIAPTGTRFRMTNPRAEQWIRQNVANRVVGFASEQVEVARAAIQAGYAAGQGPQGIAVDLAGRVVGGARTGGVLGLDGPRAARLQSVANGMRSAEGVRTLVIRRDDGALVPRYKVNTATAQRLIKAYRAGTAVPDDQRAISERQYKNALLQSRANTVSATETGNAVMGARDEEWRQLAESQGLRSSQVIKTWQHRRGASANHRPDHLAMSGHSVRGLDTPFEFTDGTQMMHAHDPAGGAKHNINCGCDTEYRLDHAAGLE